MSSKCSTIVYEQFMTTVNENVTFNNKYYNNFGILNVCSAQMIFVTLKLMYHDCGCLQFLLVHEDNFNMSKYNLNIKNLPSTWYYAK